MPAALGRQAERLTLLLRRKLTRAARPKPSQGRNSRPNTRLSTLLDMTGWTKRGLARRVNRQAAAMGHPQLATDASRVRRWIDVGEVPREPVPRVLAALFTERLGRVVTVSDLGLARQKRANKRNADDRNAKHPAFAPWAPERTAAVLTEFTGMDIMLNRRGSVATGTTPATGSALSSAMHDWLQTPPAHTSWPESYTPAENLPQPPAHPHHATRESLQTLEAVTHPPLTTQQPNSPPPQPKSPAP